MSSTTVEKIKDRLDVVEVVGSYLQLQKAGVNYKAKCPFHNERTPSFLVSPGRGTFYCFGCHEKGDIFSFVEKFEGTDFKGALKILADRAGVALEKENKKEKSEHDRLYAALDTARRFFIQQFGLNKEAREYIAKRGVKSLTTQDWSIGFAPNEWRTLLTHLKSQGFKEEEILKSGLIKQKDEALVGGGAKPNHSDSVALGRSDAGLARSAESGFREKYYDTFRGRVMFPIFDTTGKTVGFSGRTLSANPDTPKYINSPEGVLFNKSELLYGLHAAKGEIRKKNYSILVEGQMDLVMCHQAGFKNTTASSGTALTATHLMKLKKLSPRIIMAFDSDSARLAAAEKAGRLALSLAMEVKIAALPKGSDPADLIIRQPKLFAETLKKSKHIIDFELDVAIASTPDKRNIGKVVREKVLPFVRDLESNIDKSYYVSQIASKIGLREEAIWEDIKALPAEKVTGVSEKAVPRSSISSFSIEKRIMGILYWKPELTDFKEKVIAAGGEDKFLSMRDESEAEAVELAYIAEQYFEGKDIFKDECAELILSLEKKRIQDEIYELRGRLNENTDAEAVNEIMKAINTQSKRIEEIKRNLSHT